MNALAVAAVLLPFATLPWLLGRVLGLAGYLLHSKYDIPVVKYFSGWYTITDFELLSDGTRKFVITHLFRENKVLTVALPPEMAKIAVRDDVLYVNNCGKVIKHNGVSASGELVPLH